MDCKKQYNNKPIRPFFWRGSELLWSFQDYSSLNDSLNQCCTTKHHGTIQHLDLFSQDPFQMFNTRGAQLEEPRRKGDLDGLLSNEEKYWWSHRSLWSQQPSRWLSFASPMSLPPPSPSSVYLLQWPQVEIRWLSYPPNVEQESITYVLADTHTHKPSRQSDRVFFVLQFITALW